jgi:hypothetical protein
MDSKQERQHAVVNNGANEIEKQWAHYDSRRVSASIPKSRHQKVLLQLACDRLLGLR